MEINNSRCVTTYTFLMLIMVFIQFFECFSSPSLSFIFLSVCVCMCFFSCRGISEEENALLSHFDVIKSPIRAQKIIIIGWNAQHGANYSVVGS